jgi:hypothetical protein
MAGGPAAQAACHPSGTGPISLVLGIVLVGIIALIDFRYRRANAQLRSRMRNLLPLRAQPRLRRAGEWVPRLSVVQPMTASAKRAAPNLLSAQFCIRVGSQLKRQ